MPVPVPFLAALALFELVAPVIAAEGEFAFERRMLIDEIAALANETARDTGRRAFDPRVMAVVSNVPRHRFVPADQLRNAHRNRSLPTGHGQTIS